MSRGFNWTRVAKEAQLRRYGAESVSVGLPAPESKKQKGRGKPKKPAPPSRNEQSFQQKIASAVVGYLHAVAWGEVRKMPVPAVPPILWRVLGQGAEALKKVRGDRRYPAIRRKVEARHLSQVGPKLPPKPPSPRKSKAEQRRDKRIEDYRMELARLQGGQDPERGRRSTPLDRDERIAELEQLLARLSARAS